MKMFWFVHKPKPKAFYARFVLVLYFIFFLSVCYAQPTERLRVVATNSIVGDWVKNIADDQVDLAVLVGPNADVHTFEPTPSDDVFLAKANVIFEIGFGLEHWMDKLYTASSSRAKRVALAKSVVNDPLAIIGEGRSQKQDIDPHVWHNVRYVIGMVKHISQTLQSLDPAHTSLYERNTKNYLNELQALESWAFKTVAAVPREQRKLVTNHDSLGYFCEHYQFKLVGAAFESATTEAEDLSAKDMAELIFKIKQSGVRVVFAENVSNSKVISAMAKEAHVRLAPPLYTDALGLRGSPADTYLKMMHYNVETIVTELMKG